MSLGEFSDGYNKGYAAGYDDGCVYRTILEARVRRLEADLAEARAEAAKWAAAPDPTADKAQLASLAGRR